MEIREPRRRSVRWWSADPTSGQAWAAARCLRRARRITRRSSEVPPQTPVSWLVLNELEAGGLGVALIADILGVLDLLDRHPGGADGEEEARVGVATARILSPVNTAGKSVSGQCHEVPLGYGDPSDVSVGPDTRNGFYRWARKSWNRFFFLRGQLGRSASSRR